MKRLLLSLSILVAVLSAGAAYAGSKTTFSVFVLIRDDGSGFAQGRLGGARNSPNDFQNIGCIVAGTISPASADATCVAVSSVTPPVVGVCSTNDPTLVQVAESIGGDDEVDFVWDSSGNCTAILKSSFSEYEPKQL